MTLSENKIFLEAGEGIVTRKPQRIVTILGSCLSITMFHKETGYAGMTHSLYPTCTKNEKPKIFTDEAYKYVDCSFKKMVNQFEKKQIELKDIEIKIFGGGEVIEGNGNKTISVGRQNIDMMERIARENKLEIKASDIGGNKGRKIIFDTSTGDVFSKKL